MRPDSDPAAAGVPEYADDDSSARDDVPSGREAGGRDPAPLPPDREDGPLGLDEFGTTAEEQRRGEPLDRRLDREEPEPDGRTDGWTRADVDALEEAPVDPRTD